MTWLESVSPIRIFSVCSWYQPFLFSFSSFCSAINIKLSALDLRTSSLITFAFRYPSPIFPHFLAEVAKSSAPNILHNFQLCIKSQPVWLFINMHLHIFDQSIFLRDLIVRISDHVALIAYKWCQLKWHLSQYVWSSLSECWLKS